MLIIQNTEHFRIESPTIVTIGTFDGVHLGHQQILNRLKELKHTANLQTVVLTFNPHPRKILFPEQKDLKLITLIDEKLELLENYGVDIAVVYPFSKEFSQIESHDYIEKILLHQLNTKYMVIGYDHKFGKNRSGNIVNLKKLSKKNQIIIEEIDAKDIDNIAISSSKIRKAIEEGNIDKALEYLGHKFFLNAKVIKGKQLGVKIGFPTANLKLESDEKIIPKIGVYFVELIVETISYYGMMNVGHNPTIDNDVNLKLEVHIFDFEKDIYFKNVKVNFIKRLRDEKKFNSIEDLKNQLIVDKKTCLQLL